MVVPFELRLLIAVGTVLAAFLILKFLLYDF